MERMKNVARRTGLVNGPPRLTVFDRLEFGVISAFFGVLIGGLIALIVWWFFLSILHAARPYNLRLVWFSVAYFFAMGVVRGVEAAETIALGLVTGIGGVLAVGAAELGGGVGPGNNPNSDKPFCWRPSMWWSVLYFVGVGLVAWLTFGG